MGLVELPDLIDERTWAAITREAHACEPYSFPRVNTRPDLVQRRDGSITSPQRCRAHRGGDALRRLATSAELTHLVRDATGMECIVPSRFGFKYYRRGDFMAVHRDDVKCTITISFGVTDNLEYMGWIPSLRHSSSQDVVDEVGATAMFPSTGSALPIGFRQLKGFDGYGIPHWRPSFEHDFGILGTICYFEL
ncbi:MAG: hypothetical protein ACRD0C_15870 [Acidimicrobiia bacterium]